MRRCAAGLEGRLVQTANAVFESGASWSRGVVVLVVVAEIG